MENKKDQSTNTTMTICPSQNYLSICCDVSFNSRMELHRLRSFPEDWSTLCPVPKEQLAENGFYYIAPGDATRCAFCRLVVSKWEQNDTAAAEHRRWNPACPFINGRHVGNIKLGEEELHENLSLDKERTSNKAGEEFISVKSYKYLQNLPTISVN